MIALDIFFLFFLKKIKKTKVGQNSWAFNIFHVLIWRIFSTTPPPSYPPMSIWQLGLLHQLK